MIKSMTGYGKASGSLGAKSITVEIRSLNSKQLDLNLRVPQMYKEKEAEIRNWAGRIIERGRAEIAISFENESGDAAYGISRSQVNQYYKDLEAISDEKGATTDLLSVVMRLPDVIQYRGEGVSEEEWEKALKIIGEAGKKLNEFRSKEGASLQNDLESRVKLIREYSSKVETLEPVRAENVRNKLKQSLEENVTQNVNQDRFEQEIIYYLEKLDITEERVRLATHCDYFIETMNGESSEGRKLAFISQEIGREINTMGAKANNSDIQKLVVQMKDELEKIKEQVNNVL